MSLPPFTSLVSALPETVPFVGPEAIERRSGIPTRARLGANESGFGPSPLAVEAVREAVHLVWRYPDPENHDLRAALSSRLGVSIEEVAIGEGIDGLMAQAVRMFIAPGDVVVTSLGAYPTFAYHVDGYGGQLERVPYAEDHEDLDGLSAAVRRRGARMVYLANPDNPMGSHWPAEAIDRFLDSIPQSCLVILDEAYGETAPQGTMPELDPQRGNVLRLRTFSKAHGLAGLRCGYAVGHATLIGAFNRIRNHFGVNRLAQVAALATLGDEQHLAWAIGAIRRSRRQIADIATTSGLLPLPSATNFVTVDCGRDGALAMRVLHELAEQGVFVRKPMAPVLDRCIRISAGPDAEMEVLAGALPRALAAAQGEA